MIRLFKQFCSVFVAFSLLIAQSESMSGAEPPAYARSITSIIPRLHSISVSSKQRHNVLPITIQTQFAVFDPTVSAKTDLVLNNNAPRELSIQPTLYSLDGSATSCIPIALASNQIRTISVNELLPIATPNLKFSSLSLQYLGQDVQLGAQLIARFPRGNSVDFPFPVMMEFQSRYQEATWWTPSKSETRLFISNTANTSASATISISDAKEEQLRLEPHATQVINFKSKVGQEATHARLTAQGQSSGLIMGGYTALPEGMREAILISDPLASVSSDLFAADLQTSGCIPHLTLLNRSTHSVTTTIEFHPIVRSGSAKESPLVLSGIEIRPGEPIMPDLSQLSSSGISHSSVKITSTGLPGDILGSLLSVCAPTDNTMDGNFVRLSPLRDPGSISRSTGSYPVFLGNDVSSIVTIFNVSERRQAFGAYIETEAGNYLLESRYLDPGESVSYNPRQIQQMQIKDVRGTTIKPGVKLAKLRWSLMNVGANGRCGPAPLIGRSQIVGSSARLASSFSCGVTCPSGVTGPAFDNLSSGTYNAGTILFSNVYWTFEDNYGNSSPITSPAYMTSDNSAVTYVDDPGTGTIGLTTGILGTANLNYTYYIQDNSFDGQVRVTSFL